MRNQIIITYGELEAAGVKAVMRYFKASFHSSPGMTQKIKHTRIARVSVEIRIVTIRFFFYS